MSSWHDIAVILQPKEINKIMRYKEFKKSLNESDMEHSLTEFAPSSSGGDDEDYLHYLLTQFINKKIDLQDLLMQFIEIETNMFEVFGQDVVDSTVSDMITMGTFRGKEFKDIEDVYDAVDQVGDQLGDYDDQQDIEKDWDTK